MKKLNLPIWLKKTLLFLSILGPGLITASADNDAPGIATYSMVGSTYGYSFLWLILVITVGEVVILEMAARMGAVTGKGTADLIREKFGVKMTTFAMFCLLIANLGTTVAEFAGVAAAGELFGISKVITVPVMAVVMGLLILRGNYSVHYQTGLGRHPAGHYPPATFALARLFHLHFSRYWNHHHPLGDFLSAGIGF